jgi:hypothetical protein
MKQKAVKILVLFLFATGRIFSQEKAAIDIRIDQIIADDYPNMTIYAVVENQNGEVMTGLSPALFHFKIDSMDAKVKSSILPFALKETPINYTIIFSNNGIMEGEPLDFQKNAILQFIETMKPDDLLSLYTIGEDINIVFEEQPKEAIDNDLINSVEISALQPRLYDSIMSVMRKVQRRKIERKVVIIINDGRDQNSRFTKDQLDMVLLEVGVPVYSIGMRVLDDQSLSNLNEMADLTGGAYVYSQRVDQIPDMLKSLMARIRQPYVINLRVRDLKADDLPHVMEIVIDESDFAGKGLKTFTAVKIPLPKWFKYLLLGAWVVFMLVIIVLVIVSRSMKRKAIGITKRRCPDCGSYMKDNWDFCPFCRYLPAKKKKKKKDK